MVLHYQHFLGFHNNILFLWSFSNFSTSQPEDYKITFALLSYVARKNRKIKLNFFYVKNINN